MRCPILLRTFWGVEGGGGGRDSVVAVLLIFFVVVACRPMTSLFVFNLVIRRSSSLVLLCVCVSRGRVGNQAGSP